MRDERLIEALTILLKYGNPEYPTHCEHDELAVHIDANKVSKEDVKKLQELGFFISDDGGHFLSYRFGSR